MDTIEAKKEAFIQAYQKTFGNIKKSCDLVDMARGTYYNHVKNDIEFARKIEALEPNEDFLDFAEDALVKKIKDGDTTAIIFTLKTKGKKRGYIERQEVDHSGKLNIETVTVFKLPDNGRD